MMDGFEPPLSGQIRHPRQHWTTYDRVAMAVSLPVLEYVGRPFLQRLSEASRQRVLRKSVVVRYQPGEIVYQPGDPDRGEVLQSGFAPLYLSYSCGRAAT